jgi:predicted restriction endonuclease
VGGSPVSGLPDPKSRSLARGERRYRRKVASPKQWQAIIAAKGEPCRLCIFPKGNGHGLPVVEFHHLVPRRAPYFGDDVADNIVALCHECHMKIEAGANYYHAKLAASLTDPEYAYVVGKLGESGPARLFGVGR